VVPVITKENIMTTREEKQIEVGITHSGGRVSAMEEYVDRNTVTVRETEDLSRSQGEGHWLARHYNNDGEELSFVRENGRHSQNLYYGPYSARLHYTGFDAEYPDDISHSMKCVSVDTHLYFDYSSDEDGVIKHFRASGNDRKGYSFNLSNRGVEVIIHPNHPNYASYDYPEEETEPRGVDDLPILGKRIEIPL
jgi:hypothetical protein